MAQVSGCQVDPDHCIARLGATRLFQDYYGIGKAPLHHVSAPQIDGHFNAGSVQAMGKLKSVRGLNRPLLAQEFGPLIQQPVRSPASAVIVVCGHIFSA
jgi:hypothetical protein